MRRQSRWSAPPRAALFAGATAATILCSLVAVSLASGSSQPKLTVWADNVRAPYVVTYKKLHPNANIDLQVVDQDQVLTKVQLALTSGGSVPDLIWSGDPDLYAGLEQHYAGDITKYISPKIRAGFAAGSLKVCELNGQLLCLRNDLAQEVLWYNAKLMKQYGYSVPTTWQQYKAVGLKAAKQHPGTIVGMFGSSNTPELWWSAFGCPITHVLAPQKVEINNSAAACKNMVSVVDPLLKAGAIAKIGEDDPSTPQLLKKKYTLLMQVGPSWWGTGEIQGYYHLPAGQWAASAPLRWGSQPITTGFLGGGNWFVSKKSADPKDAAALAQWLTTYPKLNREGYPAYDPAAVYYGKVFASAKYFASNPFPVLTKAASQITTVWDYVTYSFKDPFLSTIAPAIQQGKTLASQMAAFQKGVTQAAKQAGYTVVP